MGTVINLLSFIGMVAIGITGILRYFFSEDKKTREYIIAFSICFIIMIIGLVIQN